MRIGILETGVPPGNLGTQFGSYANMMTALLGPGFETETFDVRAGLLPEKPEAFAGFLITGSPAGVYDDLPWIEPLAAFLRRVRGGPKLVGLCFGHQIIAHAFGGHVVKSTKGWGLGLHSYTIDDPAWQTEGATLAIPVSHQDQVVVAPPDTLVVGRSDFTPFAMLAYQDGSAISCQGHPEFSPAFTRALLEERRPVLPPDSVEPALASLDAPNDNERVARWIRNFLIS